MTAKRAYLLPFSCLIIAILFMSIWCGGVFAFSLYVVTALLCFAAAISTTLTRHLPAERRQSIHVPLHASCWMVIILFLAISALPLPGKMDFLTGSKRYEQNNAVRAFVTEAGELGAVEQSPLRFSISRNRSGTIRILLLAIAMMGSAALSASLPGPAKRHYLQILTLYLLVVAALGFVHQWIIPKEKTIWWLWSVPHGQPVGSFVCRTHHAGFIAMGCPIALIFFLASLSRRKWLQALLYGIAFLTIGLGVTASLSRGALLACAVSIILIIVFSLFRGRIIVSIPICISAFLLVGCIAIAIAGIPDKRLTTVVRERIETLRHPLQTDSARSRLSVWRTSLSIWRDYPILGVGANGFRMLFPQYRSRTDRQPFSHTENEYAELLVDTGLTGVLLVGMVLTAIILRWRKNIKAGYLPPDISLCVAGSTFVAVIHNAMDFPLHAPLYAIVYASIIGLVLHRRPSTEHATRPKGPRLPARTVPGVFATLGLLALLSLAIYGTRPYKMDSSQFMQDAKGKDLIRALSAAPTSWYLWTRLGSYVFRAGTPESMLFGERCASRAAGYDPNNYLLWEAVGQTRLLIGDEKGAEEAFARMTKLREWKKGKQINKDKY